MEASNEGENKPDPLINSEIKGCRIEAILGKGGMGSVYRAHHIALDKSVAVKLLAPWLAADPDFVERFFREARSAAKLEHPNIVQVLDVGAEHGHYFMIMQYVEGETLEMKITREGRLQLRRATEIARDIAIGLGAAHRHGIIHRDVKPANILLTPDGQLRIADFGLARKVVENKGLTVEGAFVGTPEYVSPEQAEGRRVDPRGDLYALGICYYEMLSGGPPFKDGTTMDIAMKHIQTPPPPLRGVDGSATALIMKLLEKKAENRFQASEDLIKALEKILSGPKRPQQQVVAPDPVSASPDVKTVTPPTPRPSLKPPPYARRRQTKGMFRAIRNAVYWFILLLCVVGTTMLGGLASAALLDMEFAGFFPSLLHPFQPSALNFPYLVTGIVLTILLMVTAFLINAREFRKTITPVLSGFCTVAGLLLLYVGAFHLPASGEAVDVALSAPLRLAAAWGDRASFLPLAGGLLVPTLAVLWIEGGRRGSGVMVPSVGLIAIAVCVFLYSFASSVAGAGEGARPQTAVLVSTLAVGVISLALTVYLLVFIPGGNLLFLGSLLFVLSLAAFYSAGVCCRVEPEPDWLKSVGLPIRDLGDRFTAAGGPGLVGIVGVVWGGLLLHRRARSSYYGYE